MGPQSGASRLESAAENPGVQVTAGSLTGAGGETGAKTLMIRGKDCGYGDLGSSWAWGEGAGQQKRPWEVLPVCETLQGRARGAAEDTTVPWGVWARSARQIPRGPGSCNAGQGLMTSWEGGFPFSGFKERHPHL